MDSEFYIDKQIMISHVDGYRFRIFTEDDPKQICISYEHCNEDGWKEVDTIRGIWGDSINMIANAIKELGDVL